MFAPIGYVSLASLWVEFSGRHREPLTLYAFENLDNLTRNRVPPDFLGAIGSFDDFFEDLFLNTLVSFPLFVTGPDGRAVRLDTALDEGRHDVFAKMSPFESAIAANELMKK
ncbi:MAG: hypothetical protein JJ872_15420 [Marivivens sp.]|nr:hypothetical protein [Marivivens sp.]